MALKIVDVAGLKKSGKTTVVENIVQELSARGYKVGTLKKIHIPDFTIDQPGKDTFRHKQAGAQFVICLAPTEVALIKRQSSRKKIAELMELIPKDTEFLICEELNEKRDDILYIITLTNLNMLEETLKVRAVGEKVLAISGIVSNTEYAHKQFPVINSTIEQGRKEIVDLIIKESLA